MMAHAETTICLRGFCLLRPLRLRRIHIERRADLRAPSAQTPAIEARAPTRAGRSIISSVN